MSFVKLRQICFSLNVLKHKYDLTDKKIACSQNVLASGLKCLCHRALTARSFLKAGLNPDSV